MFLNPVTNSSLLAPLQALASMQAELARLLGEPGPERPTSLAFALYTRDGSLLLRTPLPNVEAKDLALEIDTNVLTLSGQFVEEAEAAVAVAKHIERPRGGFTRTLRLPFEIDAARVQAKLERGVLEVELPRLQQTPPVKIPIATGAPRN